MKYRGTTAGTKITELDLVTRTQVPENVFACSHPKQTSETTDTANVGGIQRNKLKKRHSYTPPELAGGEHTSDVVTV